MLSSLFSEIVDSWITEVVAEQENRLRYALYYLIPNPIKGEVTKGKLRWRGLYLLKTQNELPQVTLANGSLSSKYAVRFPTLCGKQSRSGKRKEFKIDLNFQGDILLRYEIHRASEDAFVFGITTSNESRYKVNGLVKQIKQNHEQAKT